MKTISFVLYLKQRHFIIDHPNNQINIYLDELIDNVNHFI